MDGAQDWMRTRRETGANPDGRTKGQRKARRKEEREGRKEGKKDRLQAKGCMQSMRGRGGNIH
jgi:hypothetical protein